MSWIAITCAIAAGVLTGNLATFLILRRYWRPAFMREGQRLETTAQ